MQLAGRDQCLACATPHAAVVPNSLLPAAAPGCFQIQDTPLTQLPGELVTHVLRHVEQQQRLGSCARVQSLARSSSSSQQ